MRLALHASILVCLLVMTGCVGLAPPTPDFPPGVTNQGVPEPTRLADAHEDRLRAGYRLDSTTTYRASNGTILQQIESETRWSPRERAASIRFSNQHAVLGSHAEVYSNESGTWIRIQRESGHVSSQTGATGDWRSLIAGPGGAWSVVYVMASTPETDVTLLANGTSRIRFDGGHYGRENASGTLYVSPAGLVVHYELTYDGTWRQQEARVTSVRTYSDVRHPNVERPRWVANQTTT